MGLRYFKLIIVLSLVIAIGSYLFLSNSFDEDSLRICIAWAAKIAAVFFALAFGVSSFQFFFKDLVSKRILSIRPELGLCFAVFHTAHLIFLFILQQEFHPVFDLAKRTSLIGGGMAYIFMYLMVLTTFPRLKRDMSSIRWKILHIIGGYWIWLIFFRSYFKNVMNRGEEYLLFILFSAVILLRTLRRISIVLNTRREISKAH